MRKLFFLITPILMLACGPVDEAIDLDTAELPLERPAPPSVPTVIINPAVCVGAYYPGVCTCPAGFVPGPGYCVRSASPLDECNSNADCQTVRGNPSPCHAWSCQKMYPPPDDYDGCTSLPLSGGQACVKPAGGNGTCGSGPVNAGNCL